MTEAADNVNELRGGFFSGIGIGDFIEVASPLTIPAVGSLTITVEESGALDFAIPGGRDELLILAFDEGRDIVAELPVREGQTHTVEIPRLGSGPLHFFLTDSKSLTIEGPFRDRATAENLTQRRNDEADAEPSFFDKVGGAFGRQFGLNAGAGLVIGAALLIGGAWYFLKGPGAK